MWSSAIDGFRDSVYDYMGGSGLFYSTTLVAVTLYVLC